MSGEASSILATGVASADPVVRLALGWSLATLLATAAWHKARDLHVFAAVLWNYELLPRAAVKPVAAALVVVESVLAVAFAAAPASSQLATVAGYATVALMGVYAFAIGVNLWRGRYDMSCGCEGGGREEPLHAGLLARNAAIALAAVFVAGGLGPAGVVRELLWFDWLTAGAAAVTLVFLWSAAARLLALGRAGASSWRPA